MKGNQKQKMHRTRLPLHALVAALPLQSHLNSHRLSSFLGPTDCTLFLLKILLGKKRVVQIVLHMGHGRLRLPVCSPATPPGPRHPTPPASPRAYARRLLAHGSLCCFGKGCVPKHATTAVQRLIPLTFTQAPNVTQVERLQQ